MHHSSGMLVAILGPDGSGKSSVIEHVECEMAATFQSTTCFHFTPSVFRRAAGHDPVLDPHGEPPRGVLSSLIKCIYLVVDFWVGYRIAIRPRLDRFAIIFFDRYMLDTIVDPRRYRLSCPHWMLCVAWWLVPKPDIVILLDAPPDVLQRRKQEVPLEETARQREAYRKLVMSLPYGYIVDAGKPLSEVVTTVSEVILKCTAKRDARRIDLDRAR